MNTTLQAPPAHEQNPNAVNASSLYSVCIITVLAFPGALAGAVVAWATWRVTHTPAVLRWLFAALGIATAALFRDSLLIGWPVRMLLNNALPSLPAGAVGAPLLRSAQTECLVGPFVASAYLLADHFRVRTLFGAVSTHYARTEKRSRAMAASRRPAPPPPDMSHPPGAVRLGLDAELLSPFDLDSSELAAHVFVPGASNTGKTTTLVRLSHGALAAGMGIVIVDCKGRGSGLLPHCHRFAATRGLPLHIVEADDAATLGYDPCSGDAAGIANKLIGAFSFSGDAEIYKQVALEVVPVIARALRASGSAVTLEAIYDALGKGGLAELGRRAGAEPLKNRLLQLQDSSGSLGAAGYTGLQRRLGALMEGKFGDLFRQQPALDWDAALAAPSLTYIGLSTTATEEDVELFGRVIAQDLKQVADRRLRASEDGAALTPFLVIFDEFTALREAEQVKQLLLQARQARMSVVVASQYIPGIDQNAIRTALLQAGVLIVHRLAHDDAEQLSKEMGTHKIPFVTAQVDTETGESDKQSVRIVDEFNVHPNTLRTLPTGTACVYSRPTERRALVRVHREES